MFKNNLLILVKFYWDIDKWFSLFIDEIWYNFISEQQPLIKKIKIKKKLGFLF